MSSTREPALPARDHDRAPSARWLLTARVTAPLLVPGYVHRPALFERIDPLEQHRLVVLKAPGGFGKTMLLADLARRQRERDWLVAWLALTADDTPAILGAYLAYAFRRAGLDPSVLDVAEAEAEATPWRPGRHTALLTRVIETHAAPCLLVLDDADRLAHRDAIETVNTLLRYSPPNLHIAVACRRNPGLDVDGIVLDDRGISLGGAQLRFSTPEIARFMGADLAPGDVEELVARTDGWPVALQLYRNLRAAVGRPVPVREFRGDKGVTANFLGKRLLGTLAPADRDFLLDLALFDWIDPALVDEVLGTGGTRRRLAELAELDGFLHDRGGGVVRLHPLLQEYCAAQRFRETPDRFRRLQIAIARALEQRNWLVPAVRHARDAGDDRLVGDILERAGGLRLWIMEGVTRLRALDRCLTPAVLKTHPRVALLHCLVFGMRGKLGEAQALFEDVERRTEAFTRDREGGDDRRLAADGALLRAVLHGFGCLPIGAEAVRAAIGKVAVLADDADLDPAVRGVCAILLCGGNYERARFDLSRRRAAEAQAHFARCGSRYGAMFHAFHAGLAAVAEGQVPEAAGHYARARQIVNRFFPEDGGSTAILDVLETELDLERNLFQGVAPEVPAPATFRDLGAWFDFYAAAYGVAAEAAGLSHGAAAALAVVDQAAEHAGSLGMISLARCVSGMRVTVLVLSGHAGEAEHAWRDGRLPEAAPALFDLRGQTWREMEAIADARIRLLAARGDLAAARDVATRLCDTAAEHGLVRTLMRGLVLAMVIEHQAGDAVRAEERLAAFLARVRTTDYPRSLVREGAVSREVLERLIGTAPDAALRDTAKAMLAHLQGPPPASDAPAFTPREVQVLRELAGGARDREIAARLRVSENGVRYHLKHIYRKLRASGRQDAVRRVRDLGLLP